VFISSVLCVTPHQVKHKHYAYFLLPRRDQGVRTVGVTRSQGFFGDTSPTSSMKMAYAEEQLSYVLRKEEVSGRGGVCEVR